MTDKHYPRTERSDLDAHVDAPAKPCAKRINHENLSRFETSITWCSQPDGHAGQCSGPLPSVLPPNDTGPKGATRRRW